MNGEDFWNLTVLAIVFAGCLFYIWRAFRRTMGGASGGRCSRCSRGKTCGDFGQAPSETSEV